MKLKNIIIGTLVLTLSIGGGILGNVKCVDAKPELDTGRGLQVSTEEQARELIEEANEDGKISKSEKNTLKSVISTEAKEEYIATEITNALNDEKIQKCFEISECGEEKTYEYSYDNGTNIRVSVRDVEDEKDNTSLAILSNISNLFVTDVMAGTHERTKKYGNRMCSWECTVFVPIGWATIYVENHYNLSEKGIKERYGWQKVEGFSLTGSLDYNGCDIEDNVATKPGKSDTDVLWTYSLKGDFGLLKANLGTVTIQSKLKYMSINKKKKEIKLKEIFS